MSDIPGKKTDFKAMPTYAFCPVITALEVIGERWVILILRDLLRNPTRRFQDLQDSLKGCAPSTLSTRLKALEAHGLIERRLYEQHPPRLEYLLTVKGRAVGPVVASLRDWGLQLQAEDPDSHSPL
jgi:DNA-binding HxlR family transcriptional regulator